MILAPHAIIGTAIVAVLPDRPVLGLGLAFVSHFALDALPHWDYKLRSMVEDKQNPINNNLTLKSRGFAVDLIKISADFFLGLILSYLLFGNIIGALAAVFPDLLQFVFMKTKWRWLRPLQRFHLRIHYKI